MTTVKNIRDVFSNLSIDPIIVQPNYKAVHSMHVQIDANAASIHSHLENGCLGLLALTVTPAIFNTLSHTPFVVPENPVPNPVYPPLATQYQIQTIQTTYENNTIFFSQFDAYDCTLKQLLLVPADDMFISALKNIITLALLTHVYSTYANINSPNIEENSKNVSLSYNVNNPIKIFFTRIKGCARAQRGSCRNK